MNDLSVAIVAEPLFHRVSGGTGVATRALLDGLSERSDVEVFPITARHRRRTLADSDLAVGEWLLPRAILYESWARAGGRPGSSRVARRADLLHSPMLPTPRRGDRPLVVTLHDLAFFESASRTPKRARRLYERLWERVKIDADLVLCSSQTTLEHAVAKGLHPDSARLVPLGASVPAVDESERRRVSQKFGLSDRFVLSVGTAEPRKNLPRLLEAFARSDLASVGVELVVVGPSGWREQLADRVSDLSPEVESRVRALGEVDYSDLHAMYSAATVFCYPSLLEGFGLPVLEAMAHGTAVITSATTSTAEIAGDAGVLIDPYDTDELAAALRQLVDDGARRDDLGRASVARAGLFTWDRHVQLTVEAYRELVP